MLLAPSAPWGTLADQRVGRSSRRRGSISPGSFGTSRCRPEAWIAETHALDLLPPGEREATFARFVPESGLATFEILHWAMDARRATLRRRAHDRSARCCASRASYDRVNPPKTVASIARRYRERGHYFEVDEREPLADRRAGLGEDRALRARVARERDGRRVKWVHATMRPPVSHLHVLPLIPSCTDRHALVRSAGALRLCAAARGSQKRHSAWRKPQVYAI